VDKRTASVKDRRGYIGSTDAKRILDGEWLTLWEEKTGRREPTDLRHVFRVQLGIATESFHARWVNDYSEFHNIEPQIYHEHPTYDWLRSHIDRWLVKQDTWLELKHSNDRQTSWEIAEYYVAQCAHHCLATSRSHGWISFIPGNQEPVLVKVEPPYQFIQELLELEKAFWWHIEADVAPEMLPMGTMNAAKKSALKVVVNAMRRVDMTGNNAWSDAAGRYIEGKDAAKKFERAKKDLKELVEKDVAEASGHGIVIKRDTRGALRFAGGDDD
jgi:predicted phage-related endonuclease